MVDEVSIEEQKTKKTIGDGIRTSVPKIPASKFPKAKKFDSKAIQKTQKDDAPIPEGKIEKQQASKVEFVVGAIGSLGRSVATKAIDKYNDLYSIHYNLSEDVSIQDLFAAFGGQAALNHLQIQSSESSTLFKKYTKSLRSKDALELNRSTKNIDNQF